MSKENEVVIKFEIGPALWSFGQALILALTGKMVAGPHDQPDTTMAQEATDTETPEALTGQLCSICMEPQFVTPGGVTCKNGHGGAPALGANTGDGDHLTEVAKDAGKQAPPPPPENDVALANGIPWDSRIHSSNKKTYKKAPNDWMRKKNLTDEFFDGIVAELRALMAIETPAATGADTTETTTAAQAFGANSGISQPDTATAAAGDVDLLGVTTFVPFMGVLTRNNITFATTDPILAKYGIASLPLLGSRLDLIPLVLADLKAAGLIGVA